MHIPLIKYLLISSLLVCIGWLAEILFLANSLQLFAPIFILIQGLLVVSGLFYVPLLVAKKLIKKTITSREIQDLSIIIGVVLGNLISSPMHRLDDQWRNQAGRLIVDNLTVYRQQHQGYPSRLDDLLPEHKAQLNKQLPFSYPLKRFRLSGGADGFFLYTTSYFIFDKWIWNDKTQQFDFYAD